MKHIQISILSLFGHVFLLINPCQRIVCEHQNIEVAPIGTAAVQLFFKQALDRCSTNVMIADADGQIINAHSVSAGLDYPGVGPEHSYYKETGRAQYVAVTDKEALEAFQRLTKTEGIIPALESSHAVAYAMKLARRLSRSKVIVVCLSGRGDKDIDIVRGAL